MRWFSALNDTSESFHGYAQMLKVAVLSAARNTNLQPHVLFDGDECDLTRWLEDRGVRVIRRRTFLYDDLLSLVERDQRRDYLEIGSGAFLRLEIPALAKEMGWQDEFVLYTDVDVMFVSDPEPLMRSLRPKYFAVAPEFERTDYKRMNTGVMLMNVPALRSIDGRFRCWVRKSLPTLVRETWDQAAYRRYFVNFLRSPKWDKLPPEFNWKPYWGDSSEAAIVHFHGPKPSQMQLIESPDPPAFLKPVLHLATPEYYRLTGIWHEILESSRD